MKPGVFSVCIVNEPDFVGQPCFIQTMGYAKSFSMVGNGNILIAFFPCRPYKRIKVMASVRPLGVHVEVALDILKADEIRKQSFLSSFYFTGVLPQLGRDKR